MPPYRVPVSGSLSYDGYELLAATLDRTLAGTPNAMIVTGGAAGAVSLGERYARERGFALKQILADWSGTGAARR